MIAALKAQGASNTVIREATEPDADSPMSSELALRLANIEALLMELLDRRKQNVRTGANRSRTVQRRLRTEVLAKGQPSARHLEMARQFLAQRR